MPLDPRRLLSNLSAVKVLWFICFCALATSVVVYLSYLSHLGGDPELKELVESHGLSVYTDSGAIDPVREALWYRRIDTEVVPYWFWFDVALGVAVGLSSIVVFGQAAARKWRERAPTTPARIVFATVLACGWMVLSGVAMEIANASRGLEPVFADSGGMALVGVVLLFFPACVVGAVLSVFSIQLKTSIRPNSWTTGQILLRLLLVAVMLPLGLIATLCFVSPFSAPAGGLLLIVLAEILRSQPRLK